MTVVDELVARLGFDYQKRGLEEFESGIGKAQKSLLSLKRSMLAMAGSAIGGTLISGLQAEKIDTELIFRLGGEAQLKSLEKVIGKIQGIGGDEIFKKFLWKQAALLADRSMGDMGMDIFDTQSEFIKKFAAVTNKKPLDVMQAISNFITSGDAGALIDFKVMSPQELETFLKAHSFGDDKKFNMKLRKEFLVPMLTKMTETLDPAFTYYMGTLQKVIDAAAADVQDAAVEGFETGKKIVKDISKGKYRGEFNKKMDRVREEGFDIDLKKGFEDMINQPPRDRSQDYRGIAPQKQPQSQNVETRTFNGWTVRVPTINNHFNIHVDTENTIKKIEERQDFQSEDFE